MFLACTNDLRRKRKPGTIFQTVGRSSDELVMWAGHFDRFYQSQTDLHAVVPELANLLRNFAPNIVHIHHSLLVGVERVPYALRRYGWSSRCLNSCAKLKRCRAAGS